MDGRLPDFDDILIFFYENAQGVLIKIRSWSPTQIGLEDVFFVCLNKFKDGWDFSFSFKPRFYLLVLFYIKKAQRSS